MFVFNNVYNVYDLWFIHFFYKNKFLKNNKVEIGKKKTGN